MKDTAKFPHSVHLPSELIPTDSSMNERLAKGFTTVQEKENYRSGVLASLQEDVEWRIQAAKSMWLQ